MPSFLKKLYIFIKSKFLKFLIEVWEGVTDEMLQESHGYINEIVQNVENIGVHIDRYKECTVIEIVTYLETKYGYSIYGKDVENIREDKGDGKAVLAYRLIKERLAQEDKNLKKSVIRLGIELAVNRFFK